MRVVLDHITKRFADVTAVSEFSATLEDGELVSLLGPSGCGKAPAQHAFGHSARQRRQNFTLTIRMTSMPPEKRGIGLSSRITRSIRT